MSDRGDGSRTPPVFVLDANTLLPVGMEIPCPSIVEGPFLSCDATFMRCSHLAGHDGPHVAHMEWTDAKQ